MASWGGAWNTVQKGASKAADYTPIVSNVKGAVQGDAWQALGGPFTAGVRDLKTDEFVPGEDGPNAGVAPPQTAGAMWSAPQQAAPQWGAPPSTGSGGQEAGWGNKPGYAETAFKEIDWNQPSQAQQYWNGNQGAFNGAQNLDGAYDQAFNRGSEQLSNKFRAGGMFGGGANQDALSDFGSNLYADKAMKEGDFRLRSGTAGMNAALGLDDNSRADTYAKMQGAATANSEVRNRQNDMYDQTMGLNDRLSGLFTRGTADMYDADQTAFDNSQQAGAASSTSKMNTSRQSQDDMMQAFGLFLKSYNGGGAKK